MNEQPQLATANDTIVNMIWSDAPTGHSSWFKLVNSLQPVLEGPKLHLGMMTHSVLWRTPLDDLPLHVIPFLRIWSISGLLLSSPWMKHEGQLQAPPSFLGQFKRFATLTSVGGAFCPC